MLVHDTKLTSNFLEYVADRSYDVVSDILSDRDLLFIIPQFANMNTCTTYATKDKVTYTQEDKMEVGDMRDFWQKWCDEGSCQLPDNWYMCWIWRKDK